jgi:hypothetical protein
VDPRTLPATARPEEGSPPHFNRTRDNLGAFGEQVLLRSKLRSEAEVLGALLETTTPVGRSA